MKYVLDASVALKWVLPETDSDKANNLRNAFVAGTYDLVAPDVFPSEVVHGLTRAERKNEIAVGEASLLLADVLTTLPGLVPVLPHLIARAVDLSSTERHSAYDCLYMALAESENCEFVTADGSLIKKLGAKYTYIRALATFP
jgi:predicted nucleic acid-binding protein